MGTIQGWATTAPLAATVVHTNINGAPLVTELKAVIDVVSSSALNTLSIISGVFRWIDGNGRSKSLNTSTLNLLASVTGNAANIDVPGRFIVLGTDQSVTFEVNITNVIGSLMYNYVASTANTATFVLP